MPAAKLSLKARALRYLSTREHSRIELARKLARYASENDDIDALLDQLEAAKLLSDSRFSESLINRRSNRYGNNRILSELHSHGIDADSLAQVKAGLAANEAARATEALRKKFSSPPTNPVERVRRERFLMQRGFTGSAIRDAIRITMREVDDDIVGQTTYPSDVDQE